MARDTLPDSRTRDAKGGVRSPLGTLIPIYCANCGKRWGLVPENAITFAFALCESCAESLGPIAHTYQEPDAVFWDRIEAEELEAQRKAGEHTIAPLVIRLEQSPEDRTGPLAALARDWQAHVRRAL